MYIDGEKRYGISTEECKDYKISTACEAADIIKRLLDDDYSSNYTKPIEEKWGEFPYEKTTYADGSTSYKHYEPSGLRYMTPFLRLYSRAPGVVRIFSIVP